MSDNKASTCAVQRAFSDGDELRGLVCLVGIGGALSLRQYERTFDKSLSAEARQFLVSAWIALEVIPRDAGAERRVLEAALCKLRDSWTAGGKQ